MPTLDVWYDGDCPLCRREIALMRRLDVPAFDEGDGRRCATGSVLAVVQLQKADDATGGVGHLALQMAGLTGAHVNAVSRSLKARTLAEPLAEAAGYRGS